MNVRKKCQIKACVELTDTLLETVTNFLYLSYYFIRKFISTENQLNFFTVQIDKSNCNRHFEEESKEECGI